MAEAPKAEKGGAMRIDPKLVRELAELLNETGLNEIEIQDGDRKIKVGRQQPFPEALGFVGREHYPREAASALTAPPMPGKEDLGTPPELAGAAVKSPMVGTAFLSPQPGTDPFVAIGDTVKAGDTLLIIEAMKVMNPITAPDGGVVKQIMVSDAQPVEFDQPLVVIG